MNCLSSSSSASLPLLPLPHEPLPLQSARAPFSLALHFPLQVPETALFRFQRLDFAFDLRQRALCPRRARAPRWRVLLQWGFPRRARVPFGAEAHRDFLAPAQHEAGPLRRLFPLGAACALLSVQKDFKAVRAEERFAVDFPPRGVEALPENQLEFAFRSLARSRQVPSVSALLPGEELARLPRQPTQGPPARCSACSPKTKPRADSA